MKKTALLLFSLCFLFVSLNAQVTLTIAKIDTTQFPSLKVHLVTQDGGTIRRDLTASVFTLKEDGFVQLPINYDCPLGNSNFSLAFLIAKGTGVTSQNLDIEKAAANSVITLFDGMFDEGEIISYATSSSLDVFLTTDKTLLENGVNSIILAPEPNKLWDALASAIMEIKNNASNNSKAVLVISNGADEGSVNSLGSVTSVARNNDIKVYCVAVGVSPGSPGASNLQSIASNTGGKYWPGPAGNFEQQLVNILRGTPEACILQYTTSSLCRDGFSRMIHIDATIGGQSGSVEGSYKMLQDATTFQNVLFKIAADSVIGGHEKTLPISLMTPLVNKRFYPAQIVLTFDTSKIKMSGVNVLGTLSDSMTATFTNLATGVQINFTDAKVINGSGVLLNLNFITSEVLQAVNIPISFTSFTFSKGCLVPQILSGQLVIYPKPKSINHLIDAPSNLPWDISLKDYNPNPVTIGVKVRNTGEVLLTNVQGSLKIQSGLSFVSGYNESQIASPSSLAPGEEANLRWDIRVDPQQSLKSFILPLSITTDEGASSNSSVVIQVDQAGPKLNSSCTAPSIKVQNNDYSPNPFPINLSVENLGGTAAAPQATIILPAGLSLENDYPTKLMASISPALQGSMQWQVRASKSNQQKVYTIKIVIEGTGFRTDTCSLQVTTPALSGATITTSCIEMPIITMDTNSRSYQPNPFILSTKIYNWGAAKSDSITLILTLPPEMKLSAGSNRIDRDGINSNDSVTATFDILILQALCSDKTIRILLDVLSKGNVIELCTKDVLLQAKPNKKPVINTSLPAPFDTARVGDTKMFSVQASDPDNDKLHYQWKVDGLNVGSDTSIMTQSFSSVGNKKVTCVVTDGCASDSASWSFYVNIKTAVSLYDNAIEGFDLNQNYPNPILSNTSQVQISFTVPHGSHYVEIKLYDAVGKELRTLVSGLYKAGMHSIELNRDIWNYPRLNKSNSGIYFYRMVSGSYQKTRPMILMR